MKITKKQWIKEMNWTIKLINNKVKNWTDY